MVRRLTSALQRRAGPALGDSPATSDRLQVLAQVFATSSATLLETLPVGHPTVVLDLGCGPGHSTRLLRERFKSADVTGADISAAHLAEAATLVPSARFVRHDVTTMPLPRAPVELAYGRLLLAHVRHPARLVASWTGQLVARGWLVLEDVEWIRTDDTVFLAYLELASALLRSQDTELYAGQLLAAMPSPRGTAVVHTGVATVEPTVAQAAAMFVLDLTALRGEALARIGVDDRTVDELDEALTSRLQDGRRDVITWGMRQVALRRWGGR